MQIQKNHHSGCLEISVSFFKDIEVTEFKSRKDVLKIRKSELGKRELRMFEYVSDLITSNIKRLEMENMHNNFIKSKKKSDGIKKQPELKDLLPKALKQKEQKEITKELYTKEDVIYFLQLYRLDLSAGRTPIVGNTTKDWFETVKKK